MRQWMTQWCVLLLIGVCAAPAGAQPKELDGTEIEDAIYRAFSSNWRKYARHGCEIEGFYAYFPKYDRRYESSLNQSTSQVMDEMTERWEENAGNLIIKKSKRPPREDAEAFAKALPDMKIGSYGWVDSVEIVKVIDRDEMYVREIWLVDKDKLRKEYASEQEKIERRNGDEAAEEELKFDYAARIKLKDLQEQRQTGFTDTFRLTGFDTRGLRVGSRWHGPNNEGFQVGVVRWEVPKVEDEEAEAGDEDDRRRSRSRRRDPDPIRVLAPIEEPMRESLNEEQFKKMLLDRGMTVTGFVDLLRSMRDLDRRNADERIHNELIPPEAVVQE